MLVGFKSLRNLSIKGGVLNTGQVKKLAENCGRIQNAENFEESTIGREQQVD